MNRRARRARRAARRSGCLAAYTAEPGGTPAHTAAICDGRCREHELTGLQLFADALAGLPADLRELLASTREVTPAPPGADFGMTGGMLRALALIARQDGAKARATALATLRSWAGAAGAALVHRIAVLLGLMPTGRPLAAGTRHSWCNGPSAELVAACPHTGPPARPTRGNLREADTACALL